MHGQRRCACCARVLLQCICVPTHRRSEAQVIQRERLVSCMLEHIQEAHAGRVHVRHSIQVQQLAVREGGKVSLKWKQVAPQAAAPSSGPVTVEGSAETDFVVRYPSTPHIHTRSTSMAAAACAGQSACPDAAYPAAHLRRELA